MKKVTTILFASTFMLTSYHFAKVKSCKNMLSIQNQIVLVQSRYITILRDRLNRMKRAKEVTITAYTPTKEECDNDPLVTASMRKVRLGTVAVSRDLFAEGWVFGMKIYIWGHGIFEINDLMNARYLDRVDIFMWDKVKAKKFGKKVAKATLLGI